MTVPLPSMSVRRATEVALAQDHRSFEDFYEQNHGRLFVALCLVTGDRHEAEDIMQESFVRLWERWDRMGDVKDPAAFLYRTAMNVFRGRYRRARLAIRKTFAASQEADDLAAVADRDALLRVLQNLIPQQRAAILLTGYLGYTSEEAGKMLGMRASTVRVLTSRARAAMKDKVEDLR